MNRTLRTVALTGGVTLLFALTSHAADAASVDPVEPPPATHTVTCVWLLGKASDAAHPFVGPQTKLNCTDTLPTLTTCTTELVQVDDYTVTDAQEAKLDALETLTSPSDDAPFSPHNYSIKTITGPLCAQASIPFMSTACVGAGYTLDAPVTAGVVYEIEGRPFTHVTVTPPAKVTVTAVPADGYVLTGQTVFSWDTGDLSAFPPCFVTTPPASSTAPPAPVTPSLAVATSVPVAASVPMPSASQVDLAETSAGGSALGVLAGSGVLASALGGLCLMVARRRGRHA